VFDGEDALLAVSAGGLGGHGGVPFLPSWFATFALMEALIISHLVWRSLDAANKQRGAGTHCTWTARAEVAT